MIRNATNSTILLFCLINLGLSSCKTVPEAAFSIKHKLGLKVVNIMPYTSIGLVTKDEEVFEYEKYQRIWMVDGATAQELIISAVKTLEYDTIPIKIWRDSLKTVYHESTNWQDYETLKGKVKLRGKLRTRTIAQVVFRPTVYEYKVIPFSNIKEITYAKMDNEAVRDRMVNDINEATNYPSGHGLVTAVHHVSHVAMLFRMMSLTAVRTYSLNNWQVLPKS